jgi:hypothetical protein
MTKVNRKTTRKTWIVGSVLAGSVAFGQAPEMKNTGRTVIRTLPDDTPLDINTQQKDDIAAQQKAINEMMNEKRAQFHAGQPKPTQNDPKTGLPVGENPPAEIQKTPGAQESSEGLGAATTAIAPDASEKPQNNEQSKTQTEEDMSSESAVLKKLPSASKSGTPGVSFQRTSPNPVFLGTPLRVFAVSESASANEKDMTVLPTGSHVKARLVSGVEANSREPYPVLLQLDYAFTGPNKTRINLANCFMIAKAKANMSTERVIMETEKLSCVRENGEHIKREAKGFVAGSDNTFGATGTYISKQGQVLLAAVLASIAKNAGSAIADAQKTTSVLGADKAATATNITGNKAAFVAGSAMVDGAGMVAQWYLEQAKELLPSIGVGSGADVFVVMLDSVLVPNLQEEE